MQNQLLPVIHRNGARKKIRSIAENASYRDTITAIENVRPLRSCSLKQNETGSDTDLTAQQCAPDNSVFETSGCACDADEQCTCQVFTGAEFLDEAETSRCDGGVCVECAYQ